MARYIDADALIKKIYPMGIGDGKYILNAKAVKLAIDNAPTADVVPKSEVEKIFVEIYRSVASRIPMEIRPIFKDDRDFDAGFINGKRDALLDVLVLASELKKKYTEGTE